jgi:HK97 family phage portal protein
MHQLLKKEIMRKWWKQIRSDFQKKSSRFATLTTYQSLGKPVWTNPYYETQVISGYQRNPMVYRCITLIAKSLAGIPLSLVRGSEPITDHPILKILSQPNPLQSYAAFLESAISYWLLSGNCFIEAVDGENSLELYTLRPDRVQIIPGAQGFPEGYEYSMGSQKQRLMIDSATGQSPLLHLKFFNPLNDWYGLSPLDVAQQSIDLQNTVLGHNLALLQNEGRPSGALIVKNNRRLNEHERQQLRDDMQAFYAGSKNSGRMMILEGDLDWREMGLSPKELDFSSGRSLSGREIAQIFGIPPICVGILGDATFSNYREARQHLWDDTLLPLLDSFLLSFNQWLMPYFDESLKLTYSKEHIHAIAEKKWDVIQKSGCLTINEKRKILGYEPIKGGDALSYNEGTL